MINLCQSPFSRRAPILFLAVLFFLASSVSQSEESFEDFSLEQMMDMEITTASKKAERFIETPSAAFVITADDINRSGSTTVMDALRLSPGIWSGRIDTKSWGINARSGGGRYANKILVMVDGRAIYNSVFSGTYWELHDVMIDTVDRIEIIRGPGGSVWGANAVNGVINIITRPADESQGYHTRLIAGTQERFTGNAWVGTKLNDNVFLSVYGKYANRDSLSTKSGDPDDDAWIDRNAGFRLDIYGEEASEARILGGIHDGTTEEPIDFYTADAPYTRRGIQYLEYQTLFLQANIDHNLTDETKLSLQTYAAREGRNGDTTLDVFVDTFDLELTYEWLLDTHEITMGAGYRLHRDELVGSERLQIVDQKKSYDKLNAFLQDEWSLLDDHLRLTAGVKVEHNEFSGTEVQPNVRFALLPSRQQTIWGAVSKSARTPNRVEQNSKIIGSALPPEAIGQPIPGFVRLIGNADFDSEKFTTYEAGYRIQPNDNVLIDLAAHYTNMEDIRSVGVPVPTPGTFEGKPVLYLEATGGNDIEGHSQGIESSITLNLGEAYQLKTSYSYTKVQLDETGPEGSPETIARLEDQFPTHILSSRLSVDVTDNIQADAWLRYGSGIDVPIIEEFITLDLRLAWHPTSELDVALVGQNILDDTPRLDSSSTLNLSLPTYIERSAYLSFQLDF